MVLWAHRREHDTWSERHLTCGVWRRVVSLPQVDMARYAQIRRVLARKQQGRALGGMPSVDTVGTKHPFYMIMTVPLCILITPLQS
jgi:hypothetical protein